MLIALQVTRPPSFYRSPVRPIGLRLVRAFQTSTRIRSKTICRNLFWVLLVATYLWVLPGYGGGVLTAILHQKAAGEINASNASNASNAIRKPFRKVSDPLLLSQVTAVLKRGGLQDGAKNENSWLSGCVASGLHRVVTSCCRSPPVLRFRLELVRLSQAIERTYFRYVTCGEPDWSDDSREDNLSARSGRYV